MLLTLIQIWPITTLYIKTFRLPTPLLIFQLALIPGTILIGTLLAPLLYLSRHIAQRPLRKLRFPEEKQIHRRFLALGFYLGSALITGGLIGMWTRWCLKGVIHGSGQFYGFLRVGKNGPGLCYQFIGHSQRVSVLRRGVGNSLARGDIDKKLLCIMLRDQVQR